jgi:hypothetical protein
MISRDTIVLLGVIEMIFSSAQMILVFRYIATFSEIINFSKVSFFSIRIHIYFLYQYNYNL